MANVIRVRGQKIKRVFFRQLKQEERDKIYHIKNGPNAGKSIPMFKDKTHQVKIQMDDDKWYDAGHITAKEGFPLQWRKEVNNEWITINEGAEVEFNATPNGDFNAQIIGSSVDVIQNGPEPSNPYIYGQNNSTENNNNNNNTSYKKDYTGMHIGHGLKGGCKASSKFDVKGILELSKNVHDITQKLNQESKSLFPGMDDYNRGQTVGNAVLCACRFGGDIEGNARKLLTEVVPELSLHVKGEKIEEYAHDHVDPDVPDDDIPF